METKITLPRLHPGQKKLYAARKRFNVVRCGRRWGKTIYAVFLIAYGLFVLKVPVAYSAPSYKMMIEVWRIVSALLAPAVLKTDAQNKRIVVVGELVLDFWSLDAPEKIRGQKYGLFIVDEAALVKLLKDVFNKIIRPTLTDLKGEAWFLSTPVADSEFQQLDEMSKKFDNWQSFHAPTSDNPHIDKGELNELAEQLPNDVFDQEYNAEYVNFNGKNFVQYYDESVNVTDRDMYDLSEDIFLCFDFNIANTILVIQAGEGWMNVLKEYHGDYMDLEDHCRTAYLEWKANVIRINGDASGHAGSAYTQDNNSAYELIRSYLNMDWENFNVPKRNPNHKSSYIHCNTFFKKAKWTVHRSCVGLIRDIEKVKVVVKNGRFEIDKSNEELTHHLDPLRYHINAEHRYILENIQLDEPE